ncbi:hypothetical protein WJX74_006717 [Apatococcus lobatus]|uniref:Phosphoglycerate mutase-like protein n=1 Tax=Apatococcus lobatus TaxID=904363 RepID=A0AAW1QGZ2_9CHLO
MSQPAKRRKLVQTSLAQKVVRPSTAKESVETQRDTSSPCQAADKGQTAQKVYPMFRPKQERKVVHLVRHGQSEYNAAIFADGDPRIADAPLTQKGQEQARNLEGHLRRLHLPAGTLWVCSPLTRALHTLQLSCWHLHGEETPNLANFLILRDITEHLGTFGDLGSPASVIRAKFPQLAPLMEQLPERWWFAHEANRDASCPYLKTEPMALVKERCGKFRKWLQDRPEMAIVVVGHSTFFKTFTSSPHRLKNCEIQTILI